MQNSQIVEFFLLSFSLIFVKDIQTLDERSSKIIQLFKKPFIFGYFFEQYFAVLRIRDILARIQIRGSVSLTSGSASCYFRQ
jgi:hypothetical protein